MPPTQYGHVTRHLSRKSRVREQDHERRAWHEPLELRKRLRPEITTAFPRSGLSVNQDNLGLGAWALGARHPDSPLTQHCLKDIPRRDRVWPSDVVVDNRHAQSLAKLRPLTANQMHRPIRQPVGELLMLC